MLVGRALSLRGGVAEGVKIGKGGLLSRGLNENVIILFPIAIPNRMNSDEAISINSVKSLSLNSFVCGRRMRLGGAVLDSSGWGFFLAGAFVELLACLVEVVF